MSVGVLKRCLGLLDLGRLLDQSHGQLGTLGQLVGESGHRHVQLGFVFFICDDLALLKLVNNIRGL